MILFCLQDSNFCHQLFFYMNQYELKQKSVTKQNYDLVFLTW